MKSCENCIHFMTFEFTFSLCRRTEFFDQEGNKKYIPIMMERQAWAGCCGPDAKFFEPVNQPKESEKE